jgi:glycosyltransferase involved in cell wall biosynthesis
MRPANPVFPTRKHLKMRLAVVTNILAPYRIPLFEEMAKRCDAFLVILLADQHSNREWNAPPVTFATHTLKGVTIGRPGSVDPLHFNVGTLRVLRKFRPDVVLGGGFTPAHVAAMLYCRARDSRYISWGELTLAHESEALALRRWLRHAMVRASAGWIASSSESRDAFVHYGADASRVLISLMPVRNAQFRLEAERARQSGECARIRARHPAPLLVAAGRLVDPKGWRELLGALTRVRRDIPECTLVVAGDGPQRGDYQALAQSLGLDNVFFIGPRTQAELSALYASADLFVFPTLRDTFGAVLVEAMACGVPVVASRYAAATHDLIAHGVSGFTIDPRDRQSFAETLIRALRLPESARTEMIVRASAQFPADDIVAAAEEMVSYSDRVVRGALHPASVSKPCERLNLREPDNPSPPPACRV